MKGHRPSRVRGHSGRAMPESALRSAMQRLVVLTVLFLVASTTALTFGSATAFAACEENGSLFWDDHTAGFGSTGTRQNLVVRNHVNIGAGCETNGVIAGGTSHMSPNAGGGSLVETGWRDRTDSNGNHFFRLFTESCLFAACDVDEFQSACASPGTTVTMSVRSASPGSFIWNYLYACNGGGFSSLGSSGEENFKYASPRVETFRFGPQGSTLFIQDYHNVLQHYDSYGNLWRNFGSMTCNQGMGGTIGVPNANPATSWQTTSGSGC